MRTLIRVAATTVAAVALAVVPLAAQTIEFSGHGHAYDTYLGGVIMPGDFSFQYFLPQSPTPASYVLNQGFTLESANGTITQGTTTRATTDNLQFNIFSDGGAFAIFRLSANAAILNGPQLFSGPANAPSFTVGTFAGFTLNDPVDVRTTVSDVMISVTPEPNSVALFGTGLIGLLPLLRRRRISGGQVLRRARTAQDLTPAPDPAITSRAAYALSVASRENFTFHGHTSWEKCRHTHFEIPLSTERLTLRKAAVQRPRVHPGVRSSSTS